MYLKLVKIRISDILCTGTVPY